MTSQTMRAARFHAAHKLKVDSIPHPPPPNSSQLTINVLWCGICGTDLHEYAVGPIVISTADNPHQVTGECLPLTMGHEFCGRISALPDDYSGPLTIDQPVMVDPRMQCGTCQNCITGLDNMCQKWGFIGLNGGGGGGAGFSEFVNVPIKSCYVLPEQGLEHACLIEPLVVGRHALEVADVRDWMEKKILVLGGGPVGIAVMFVLKAEGAKEVYVSEPTKKRADMVKSLGLARDVMNPLIVGVAEELKKVSDGVGVDVVFDCAGIPAAMMTGMDALRARGTYVNVAGWEQPFVLPMGLSMLKEINIKFSMAYTNSDFKKVVEDFVAGKFAGVEKMITSRVSLEDLPSRGFDELITNKDEHVKILATPQSKFLAQG